MTEKRRFFRKDSKKLNKFIHSFTAHGVIHICTGKSVIRRTIWLFIFLAASAICLFDISTHIKDLVSKPTSTTTLITKTDHLHFPAVTVCDLNHYDFDTLESKNLTTLIRSVYSASDSQDDCETLLQNTTCTSLNLSEIGYEELSQEASHNLSDFISVCKFSGENCNMSGEMFKPVMTNLGLCYTFNYADGESSLKIHGSGQKQGLQMTLKISDTNHTTTAGAGVKVAIHPQSEPPLPDDQGYAVPTGMNAFIGIKETHIVDETFRHCKADDDVAELNFLTEHRYSTSSCLTSCTHTDIATNCGCVLSASFVLPKDDTFTNLPNCSFDNLCCIYDKQFYGAQANCSCLPPCSYVTYDCDVSISYSTFFDSATESAKRDSSLSINIYFKSFNVETKTTSKAYTFVELLSDIGGQLGLFLGISVITIIEFGAWIIDEVKDRVFGMNERKIKNACLKCCSCRKIRISEKDSNIKETDDLQSYLLDEL